MTSSIEVRNQVGEFAERISPDELQDGNRGDHIARYLFAAHFVAGRSVADLCCGVGYGANLLLAAGAQRVTGIDRDEAAINVARQHYPAASFDVADADKPLDFSDLDIAICFEGIEHVADPAALLSNMSAARLALVSSPNGDLYEQGFSGNPHHLREWTRAEFEAILSNHFSEVTVYFQWSFPDPLDQHWTAASALKAALPVSLKRKLKPPPIAGADPSPAAQAGLVAREHAVLPAGYLSILPPGLRYGRPHTWVAVCRP